MGGLYFFYNSALNHVYMASIEQLKNWFLKGKFPTQEQFWEWMSSYWHKSEKIAVSAIDGLMSLLENKAEKNHIHPQNEVTGLQTALGNKADKGHTHPKAM